MKIRIVGAAGGEVTGSADYVQTKTASVLVDCGLFQGGKKSEALNRPPTTPKQKIDAVLLTHGHLDHTGRLPLLAKRGHTMPIFATPATIAMASLIMRDSARLQVSDNERKNRKRMRADTGPALHARRRREDHPVPQAGALSAAVSSSPWHSGHLD